MNISTTRLGLRRSVSATLIWILVLPVLAYAGQFEDQTTEDADVILQSQAQFGSIVGGEPVLETDPYASTTVAFYLEGAKEGQDPNKISNFCTGTLISPEVVLTAAHCFADFAKMQKISIDELISKVQVGFGTAVVQSLADDRIQLRGVAQVAIHPEYKVGSVRRAMKVAMYDIALVKLGALAPETARFATPVTDGSVLVKGLKITLAGFGLIDGRNRKRATQLMKTDVSVYNPNLTSTQFLYKNTDGHSGCNGDSGGPAYLPDANGEVKVIGITSWGDGDCTRLGAYTSVPAFTDWILATQAELTSTFY